MMLRHGLGMLSRSSAAARALGKAAQTQASSRLLLARAMGTVTYSAPAIKIGQPAPTFKAVRQIDRCLCCVDG